MSPTAIFTHVAVWNATQLPHIVVEVLAGNLTPNGHSVQGGSHVTRQLVTAAHYAEGQRWKASQVDVQSGLAVPST